jgi:pimeloyl-ACP methyl ester carboxylesterase
MLLAQLAARPWALNGDLVGRELTSIANTSTFDALVRDLAFGDAQRGPAASNAGQVTIGWGHHDRLCFPSQAQRAHQAFPGSRLSWFERSGHFPMWEQPDQTVELILATTN